MIPALVISEQRTGSNFLLSQLDQHPEVNNFGEVFSKRQLSRVPPGISRQEFRKQKDKDPVSAIKQWIFPKKALDGTPPVNIFKFQYHNIKPKVGADLLEYLDKIADQVRIIHLIRENAFERLVSKLNAEKTEKYFVSTGAIRPREPDPYRIERLFAERGMRNYLKDVDMVTETIAHFPHKIEVKYEELTALRLEVTTGLFSFMGVEPIKTKIVSQKQSIPPRFQIKNYGKLREYFADSKYGRFFEQSPGY